MTVRCAQARAAVGLVLILLQACATPAQLLRREAANLGFAPLTLTGNGFRLTAFYKASAHPGQVLHVYLEGDGLPWWSRTRVASDPTPRNPLMLRLMAMDETPSLYLGRPCYNGHAQDPGCTPLLWTHRRYAPEVVGSMAAALWAFLQKNPHTGLTFFGHSGGGALALLLAGRFRATEAVITLAGNLDIDAWADYHGYSRLEGSLNPAHSQSTGFREFHYLGEKDERVPPSVFLPLLEKRRNAHVTVVQNIEHGCCWESLWPEMLHALPVVGDTRSRCQDPSP